MSWSGLTYWSAVEQFEGLSLRVLVTNCSVRTPFLWALTPSAPRIILYASHISRGCFGIRIQLSSQAEHWKVHTLFSPTYTLLDLILMVSWFCWWVYSVLRLTKMWLTGRNFQVSLFYRQHTHRFRLFCSNPKIAFDRLFEIRSAKWCIRWCSQKKLLIIHYLAYKVTMGYKVGLILFHRPSLKNGFLLPRGRWVILRPALLLFPNSKAS